MKVAAVADPFGSGPRVRGRLVLCQIEARSETVEPSCAWKAGSAMWGQTSALSQALVCVRLVEQWIRCRAQIELVCVCVWKAGK